MVTPKDIEYAVKYVLNRRGIEYDLDSLGHIFRATDDAAWEIRLKGGGRIEITWTEWKAANKSSEGFKNLLERVQSEAGG